MGVFFLIVPFLAGLMNLPFMINSNGSSWMNFIAFGFCFGVGTAGVIVTAMNKRG
jgi:putative effector of murein hydrolase LrgA (UPF0299 family)